MSVALSDHFRDQKIAILQHTTSLTMSNAHTVAFGQFGHLNARVTYVS